MTTLPYEPLISTGPIFGGQGRGEKAQLNNPKSREANYIMAKVYLQSGQYNDAEKSLRMVSKLCECDNFVKKKLFEDKFVAEKYSMFLYSWALIALSKNDLKDAHISLDRQFQLTPDFPDAYFYVAK